MALPPVNDAGAKPEAAALLRSIGWLPLWGALGTPAFSFKLVRPG